MPKGITNLAPLLGKMSAPFMAQLCKCHKTTPLCPPTTGLLPDAVSPLQLLWGHGCNGSLQKAARMNRERIQRIMEA